MNDISIIDVFLCHNKADKDWVRNLGMQIEVETIDGGSSSRRLKVFFDEWDIDSGENTINRINEGISKSRFLAVIMSPEFFNSGWTNLEWTDVVAEDPGGIRKKLIPILLRDVSKDGFDRIDFPPPFKALNRIDFRDDRSFEKQFHKLLRRIRGLPPQRGAQVSSRYSFGSTPAMAEEDGNSWLPDRLRDVLLGNHLEVSAFPSLIWSAEIEKDSPSQVRIDIPEAEGFIIRAKRLFTFADLSDSNCQLRKGVNILSIRKESTRDWLVNSEKANWWIALLNQALTTYLSKLAIKKDEKGRFFFRPNRDGSTRIWQNGNDKSREVAAKKINQMNQEPFWVHHAARIKFRQLGDRFFLMIEPTYLFTSDGEHPFGGQQMGRMVVMWGGRQKNLDILRNLLFWTKTIARSKKQIKIETGGQPIVVNGTPAIALSNVGIEMDHVRIGSLVRVIDKELDEVAQDVEFEADVADAEDGYEE